MRVGFDATWHRVEDATSPDRCSAWHHSRVPRPFVAYLRVYEPLSAFDTELAARLRERVAAGPMVRTAVGDRERELWLRSQVARPPRLLPGELADGRPAPNMPLDVLVLRPGELPVSDTARVGPGPLVCPLDLRPRAAAALAGFLATTWGPLREYALTHPVEVARAHATRVVAESSQRAVHMVSSTWTVPLPWFALFDPTEGHMVSGDRDDPHREMCWRAAMADVRRRIARAYSVTKDAMGEDGPAAVLRDTGRWLEHFHPHSVVELDYGGIVRLLDDETLAEDPSVRDVNAIIDAMESGDTEEIGARYGQLREFWGELAAHERFN